MQLKLETHCNLLQLKKYKFLFFFSDGQKLAIKFTYIDDYRKNYIFYHFYWCLTFCWFAQRFHSLHWYNNLKKKVYFLGPSNN